MLRRLFKDEKGFTLMEIVIVIVILGILALLAIPRLLGFTEQAEIANDKEYAAVVARAGELYWASHDKTLANAVGALANVDDDVETLINDNLVDDPNNVLQYNDGTFTGCGIDIDAGGVATVTITYAAGVQIVYSTSGGYTALP